VNEDYNCYNQIGADPVELMTMGTHSKEADPLAGQSGCTEFYHYLLVPAWNAASDGTNMGAWQASGMADVLPVSGQTFPGMR